MLALAGRQDAVALNYYKRQPPAARAADSQLPAGLHPRRWAASSGQFQRALPRQIHRRDGRSAGAGRLVLPRPSATRHWLLNALLERRPHQSAGQRHCPAAEPAGPRRALRSAPRSGPSALLAPGQNSRADAQASTAVADLLADGKLIGKFTGKDLTVHNVANRTVRVQPSGAGGALLLLAGAGHAAPPAACREEDHYLKVRRYFATRDGQPLGN
ncbi:MAG: hypothetical protein WKG07_10095 [Hymenobacter sp.]